MKISINEASDCPFRYTYMGGDYCPLIVKKEFEETCAGDTPADCPLLVGPVTVAMEKINV